MLHLERWERARWGMIIFEGITPLTLTLATLAVRARSAPPWMVKPHFCCRLSRSRSRLSSCFGILTAVCCCLSCNTEELKNVALRLQILNIIYFWVEKNIIFIIRSTKSQSLNTCATNFTFYCGSGMCFEKVKNISITIPGSDPRGPPDRPAARHWLRWAAECCLLSSQVLFSLSTPLMMGRLATGVIRNTCYLSYYLHIYTRSPHMYRSKRIHSIDIIYLYSRYICAECLLTENRYVDMYFGPWIRSCYCHLESYFCFTTETFPPRWHSWHQNLACSKRSSQVCVSGVRSSFTTAFVIFNLSCSIMFVIKQPLCINSKHWTQHIAHSCHPIKV